ncbi:hypothetical protein FLAV_02119 [Flavobacteriales bacterium]|nr:hypothetical protein [Flavobacteriales bacterium]WKZ76051.1 MAG: hypothetical protein QY303_03970 [Vicingaceae bacterium]CAG0987506.1 hypothetical protein FLAV_02119 [Flavobacteriales bacterium]
MQFSTEDLLNENVIAAFITTVLLAGVVVWIFAISKRKSADRK